LNMDQLRLPPVSTASSTLRCQAPHRRRWLDARRTAAQLAPRQSPAASPVRWVGCPLGGRPGGRHRAGSTHRAAPRLSRGAAPRLSGAAHQQAQRRADTIGPVSERVARADRRGCWGEDPTARKTSGLDPCKRGNSHCQKRPSGRAAWWPGGQESRKPMRRGFAQVAGCPAPVRRLVSGVLPAAPAEKDARSEHTCGCPDGSRCCTCCPPGFEFHV
jgi:hypothetical protein